MRDGQVCDLGAGVLLMAKSILDTECNKITRINARTNELLNFKSLATENERSSDKMR